MLVSKRFLQACQISKESEGVRGKMSKKSDDLTWNDPIGVNRSIFDRLKNSDIGD